MKHVMILVTAFVLFGASAAQAQSSFGVKVGVNLADLSANDSADIGDTKTRTGLLAGVFVVVPVSDMVAFQPEVVYSQQGAKVQDGSDEGKIELDYINVPLLARFKVAPGTPVHVLVGPQFGFRQRARVKFDGGEQDIKDDTESTDIGLVAGVAFDSGRAMIDARYTWGLRNIAKDSDPEEVKNRVFSASIGFRF